MGRRIPWLIRVRVKGYKPTTLFEQSPVRGLRYARVRPLNIRQWLLDIISHFPVLHVLLDAEGEVSDEGEVDASIMSDIFLTVLEELNRPAGYNRSHDKPSFKDGVSFIVPVEHVTVV